MCACLAAAVVLLTLFPVGTLAASGFGIFLSAEAEDGQTLRDAVRELDAEFQARLGEIRAETAHDLSEVRGARTPWREVLAVYAVKTTSGPDAAGEVVTMDDGKKALLREVFWDMQTLSQETLTVAVPGDAAGAEDAPAAEKTKLVISVDGATAEQAADRYGFGRSARTELEALLRADASLWDAVLYGITDSGDAAALVRTARSQLGAAGGETYWSWYGFGGAVEWCACFVSWCAEQCGLISAGHVPKFAWCPYGADWFRSRGLWLEGSAVPEPGMIIFFDWDKPDSGGQDGAADHTGIVERVEGGIVYTIEGNRNDSCERRAMPAGHYEILGYGRVAGA